MSEKSPGGAEGNRTPDLHIANFEVIGFREFPLASCSCHKWLFTEYISTHMVPAFSSTFLSVDCYMIAEEKIRYAGKNHKAGRG